MGPLNLRDWLMDPHKRDYIGEDGGRFFKWYTPNMFVRELEILGGSREVCTERMVFEALETTNLRLDQYPSMRARLEPYAGPQGLMHVRCLHQMIGASSCGFPGKWRKVKADDVHVVPCAACLRFFGNDPAFLAERETGSANSADVRVRSV